MYIFWNIQSLTSMSCCTGEYNPACEAGISPLSADLDFSLCDGQLYSLFKSIIDTNVLLSDKDRTAQNLSQWTCDEKSENFRLQY